MMTRSILDVMALASVSLLTAPVATVALLSHDPDTIFLGFLMGVVSAAFGWMAFAAMNIGRPRVERGFEVLFREPGMGESDANS